jgi:5'-3' exonuclease
MGIDGFGSYLRRIAPGVFKPFQQSHIRGKTVAIDMNQQLYAVFKGCKGDVEATKAHLRFMTSTLTDLRVMAFCVFDGQTKGTKPRAHERRQDAQLKWQARACDKYDAKAQIERKIETLKASVDISSEWASLLDEDTALKRKQYDIESVEEHKSPTVAAAAAAAAAATPGSRGNSPSRTVSATGSVSGPGFCMQQAPYSCLSGAAAGSLPVAHESMSSIADPAMALMQIAKLECEWKHVAAAADTCQLYATHPPHHLYEWLQMHWQAIFGRHSVLRAELDAERLAANMCAMNVVDYAVSSDYDTLAFGSPAVINMMPLTSTCANAHVLHLRDVLEALEFTRVEQLVDFAILAGCDFCERVPSVGVATAHKWIKQFKHLDHAYIQHECRQRASKWKRISKQHHRLPDVVPPRVCSVVGGGRCETPHVEKLLPFGAAFARRRFVSPDSALHLLVK